MAQEIPKKSESDSQESRNLNLFRPDNSADTPIWPSTKAEADSQRALLSRYANNSTDKGNLQLPELGDISLLKASSTAAKTELSAQLSQSSDKSPSMTTRKDGSTVEIKYEKGEKNCIIDCNKDGTARTVYTLNAKGIWDADNQTKDNAGKWASDGKPGPQYRDFKIDDNGISTAIDLVGFRHITMADGTKLNPGASYSFDEKGRIESINYIPGENRNLHFHYDANDKIDRVETINDEGKVQQTRTKISEGEWKITNRGAASAGNWQGEMELTANGTFKQRDARQKAAGQWEVSLPFEQYKEKISPDGKHINRVFKNGKELDFEKTDKGEERITKITQGKDSRELSYDADGKLTKLVDTLSNGGTQSLKTDDMIAKISSSGAVTLIKPDGSAIIKKTDFSTEEQDKDGNIQKVSNKDGKSRSFEYESVNNQKLLVKITDTRPSKNGETSEVWTRKKNNDGSPSNEFASIQAGGKEKIARSVEVLAHGDYKYKSTDGKDLIARMGSDSSSASGFSAGVEQAKERLMSALDSQLDASRKTRLEGFMKEMEKRGQDAVERQTAAGIDKTKATETWDKKIAQTYDHLAQMMENDSPSAVYNQATRAKLVENFLWIAADSTRTAQDVGNCWEFSGRNLTGMQNNPDAMARLLKEVSLTGTFTAVHGGIKSKDSLDHRKGDLDAPRKFTIPKNMLQLDRVNAGWSIDKPNDCYWQGGIGTMPSTPVGYIIDNVIGYMGGRKSHAQLDGGMWESFNSPSANTREGWYHGINELMYMATGERTSKPVRVASNDITEGDIRNLTDKRLQKQLLEHGGALLLGPGHMFAVKLVKNAGQWQIVADNQWGVTGDQVIGKVTDLRNWTVQTTRVKYKDNNV